MTDPKPKPSRRKRVATAIKRYINHLIRPRASLVSQIVTHPVSQPVQPIIKPFNYVRLTKELRQMILYKTLEDHGNWKGVAPFHARYLPHHHISNLIFSHRLIRSDLEAPLKKYQLINDFEDVEDDNKRDWFNHPGCRIPRNHALKLPGHDEGCTCDFDSGDRARKHMWACHMRAFVIAALLHYEGPEAREHIISTTSAPPCRRQWSLSVKTAFEYLVDESLARRMDATIALSDTTHRTILIEGRWAVLKAIVFKKL